MASIIESIRKQLGHSQPPTPEEIEAEIATIEKKLQEEEKAKQECSRLVAMYEKVKDASGSQMPQQAINDIDKNIEKLKNRKNHLQAILPPRPLPQPTPANTLVGRLLWDFEAASEGELSMKANQIVNVLQQFGYDEQDTDWWKVEEWDTKRIGYAPSSYIQVVANPSKGATATSTATTNRTLVPIQVPKEPEQIKEEKPICTVTALYDYKATKDDELTFAYNDTIDILSQDFPGWWKGRLNGKVGLLPANYVEEKTGSTDESSKTSSGSQKLTYGTLGRSSGNNANFKPFLAEAQYDYLACQEDELAFRKGDIIRIISPEKDGWLKGTVDGSNKPVGLVPGNYIKEVSEEVLKAERAVRRRKLPVPPQKKGQTTANSPVKQSQEPSIKTNAGASSYGTSSPPRFSYLAPNPSDSQVSAKLPQKQEDDDKQPLIANKSEGRSCCCTIV